MSNRNDNIDEVVADARELTDVERGYQCFQKGASSPVFSDQISTIKFNSSYIELIEKNHNWRGLLTLLSFIPLLFNLYTLPNFIWMTISKWEMHSQNPISVFISFIVTILVNVPLFLLARWLLKMEGYQFMYTAIRLNRKNGKIYILHGDGGVSVAQWGDAFFCAPISKGIVNNYDMKCLLTCSSVKYVWAEFEFNFSGTESQINAFWEYIRRYMEDGPKDLFLPTSYCIPVTGGFESPVYSFCRMMLNYNHFGLLGKTLLTPWIMLLTLGRMLANLVSRPPKWPDFVEAECATDPADPWARDCKSNPPYIPGIFSAIKPLTE